MNQYKEIDNLVMRYKAGDKAAGELLVLTFKPLVLSTMAKVYVPPEDWEDAFQDGICAFLEGIKKYNPQRGLVFMAFIKTHLRHYYIKRKEGRFKTSVEADSSLNAPISGEESLTLSEVLVDERVNIEGDYVEKKEGITHRHKLNKALKHLTQKQRAVIQAYYVHGLSILEISRQLGIQHQVVSKQHRAAIKKIKKYF